MRELGGWDGKRVVARRVLAAVAVTVGIGGVCGIGTRPLEAASAKITICHRTHSTTNPYRRITVAQSAVQNNRHGGHEIPNGSSNPAVYDAAFTYASNNKYWGDVIPGSTDGGSAYNGSSSIALNWTAAGRAIFFGSACQAMSAKDFYDVEIAAGVAEADVIADLNDQDANEDLALLAALGGSFTSGNVSSWSTAVAVTTDPVTSVASTSATFNGTLTVGSTSTVSGFEYGTDPALATSTSVVASPSPVTGTAAVSAAVSDLAPATTYYVRVTGTTNAGTDTEGVLRGTIVSFTTSAATSTTTTEADDDGGVDHDDDGGIDHDVDHDTSEHHHDVDHDDIDHDDVDHDDVEHRGALQHHDIAPADHGPAGHAAAHDRRVPARRGARCRVLRPRR